MDIKKIFLNEMLKSLKYISMNEDEKVHLNNCKITNVMNLLPHIHICVLKAIKTEVIETIFLSFI